MEDTIDLFNRKKLIQYEMKYAEVKQELGIKEQELNKLKEEYKELQERYNKLKLQAILNK